jgi:hypothetical protein
MLSPWCSEDQSGQNILAGYWWDPRQNKLLCKTRGVASFCFQIDLLTLRSVAIERDIVERDFFGEIDTRGASARDALLASELSNLTSEVRSDFARLLLSLEARRPIIVDKLRAEGSQIARILDQDAEIIAKFAEHSIVESPSVFAERAFGVSLEDRALRLIPGLVDNPKVGERLINAHWMVRRVPADSQSLILSDRPLIRVHGYDHPNSVWALPLTPRALFLATNSGNTARAMSNTSDDRLVKNTNMSSARQAERFVFCLDEYHAKWLVRYLKQSYVASTEAK